MWHKHLPNLWQMPPNVLQGPQCVLRHYQDSLLHQTQKGASIMNLPAHVKLVIFDVDGTLVTTKSGETFRKTADDWQWLPGRLEKLRALEEQGIYTAIATNQGGVAFGYLRRADILQEIARMGDEGHIIAFEICYAHPNATLEEYRADPPCRKPNPGMLLSIIENSRYQKHETLMVGDRPEDAEAAQNAGVAFMWADEFFSEKEQAS
jgi:HAD superfamily hydrolase (TIGR01662 family)